MADEKKCPFCAETIRAEAIKCRYCGSNLSASGSSSQASDQSAPSAAQMLCDSCKVALVAVQRRRLISAGGVIGTVLLLAGFVLAFAHLILGVLIALLGIIIGTVGAGQKTVMVCPQCKKAGPSL